MSTEANAQEAQKCVPGLQLVKSLMQMVINPYFIMQLANMAKAKKERKSIEAQNRAKMPKDKAKLVDVLKNNGEMLDLRIEALGKQLELIPTENQQEYQALLAEQQNLQRQKAGNDNNIEKYSKMDVAKYNELYNKGDATLADAVNKAMVGPVENCGAADINLSTIMNAKARELASLKSKGTSISPEEEKQKNLLEGQIKAFEESAKGIDASWVKLEQLIKDDPELFEILSPVVLNQAKKAKEHIIEDSKKSLGRVNEELQQKLGISPEDFADLERIKGLEQRGQVLSVEDITRKYNIEKEIRDKKGTLSDTANAEIEALEKQKKALEETIGPDALDSMRGALVSDLSHDLVGKNVLMMQLSTGANVADLAKMTGSEMKAAYDAGEKMFNRMSSQEQEKMLKDTLAGASKELKTAMESPEAAKDYLDNLKKVSDEMAKAGIPEESEALKDYFDPAGTWTKNPEFAGDQAKINAENIKRAELKGYHDILRDGPQEVQKMHDRWTEAQKGPELNEFITAKSRELAQDQGIDYDMLDNNAKLKFDKKHEKKTTKEYESKYGDKSWDAVKKDNLKNSKLNDVLDNPQFGDAEAHHAVKSAYDAASFNDISGVNEYASMAQELAKDYKECKLATTPDGKVSLRLTMQKELPKMKEIEQKAMELQRKFKAETGKEISEIFMHGTDKGVTKLFKVVMPKGQGAPTIAPTQP